ncbi:MAG: VCBS repeat-containing protein [Acidobacteriota bacterium]
MNQKAWSTLLTLILIASSAWAEEKNESRMPGGEAEVERRLDAAGAAQKAVPFPTQCGLSTPDFVVTGSEQLGLDEHCFPSDGGGSFGPRSSIAGPQIVDGMDVADMDNDGDNDFLVCDGLAGEVYLYTQGPPNVFTPTLAASGITSGVGGSVFCTSLREADFNGDGLKDFVVGDNRVTAGTFLYLQGPVGSFSQAASLDVSWASPSGAPCNCLFGIAAGDVDGDLRDDVIVLGYTGAGAGQVWFYQGDGAGGVAPPALALNVSADFPVVGSPTGLALFDFEEDGDLDIAVGGSFDGSHYIYLNDGLGNFTAPAGSAFTLGSFSGLDSFDVTADGREDLMAVNWFNRRLIYTQNLGGVLAAPVPVGALDGASIGIGAPSRPADRDFRLDHFKCYRAQDPEPRDHGLVGLRDQFGAVQARVLETERFCNPVNKLHGGVVTEILDPDAHLEMLRIEAQELPSRVVSVRNQFGAEQKLETGRATHLAVPTQKIFPNDHPFPRSLDHFKCYEAFGEAETIPVGLKDQFGSEPDLKAFLPRLLCNPTQKRHGGALTPIQNPLDHLVCYELLNTERIWDFTQIRNQFGGNELFLEEADLLCLPSAKRVLE